MSAFERTLNSILYRVIRKGQHRRCGRFAIIDTATVVVVVVVVVVRPLLGYRCGLLLQM